MSGKRGPFRPPVRRHARRTKRRRRPVPVHVAQDRRWFVLFRPVGPQGVALEMKTVPGVSREENDVAVTAFQQGWHGMWVFDLEPDQQKLAEHVQTGQGIGSYPGAVKLYVNQDYIDVEP